MGKTARWPSRKSYGSVALPRVSWTTKDKAKTPDWSILIYDSLPPMILREGRVIFLAINESKRSIGGILSMTP